MAMVAREDIEEATALSPSGRRSAGRAASSLPLGPLKTSTSSGWPG